MGSPFRSKSLALIVLVAALHIVVVAAKAKSEKFTLQNPCASKTSCSECIQSKSCAWCLQSQSIFGDSPRCFQPSYDSSSVCPEEFTYNPDSQLTKLENKELSRSKRMDYLAGGGGGAAGLEGSSSGGFQQSSSSRSSYSSQSSSSSSYQSSSSMSWRSEEKIVQIAPQHVNLKLRVSE